MATSVVNPRIQFFANNGRPLIGGRIHTYVAGSSTRARTYKDAAKAQPNTNPIVLDGRGEAQIYLAEGVEYKFVVEDSKGALIYTQEPVYGAIWPNAEQWPSDATLSYQYMTEAKAAADAIGPIKFYDTYAQAMGDVANIPNDGLIEIFRDETHDGARTRYFKRTGGVLEFAVNLDQLRIDLSRQDGADCVGFQQAEAGAVPRTLKEKAMEVVADGDFGGGGGVVIRSVGGNFSAGRGAFASNQNSINNTWVGVGAGKSVTGSDTDVAIGAENTGVGCSAGEDLTSGQRNIFLGYKAGSLFTTGSYNTVIQARSSSHANEKTGVRNVVIGYNAGKLLTSGNQNNFVGSDAGSMTTSGVDNSAIGQAAGQNNTTGSANTYVGAFAGTQSGVGNNNTAVGRSALFTNESGANNVAVGFEAAMGVSSGGASASNIVAIGYRCLRYQNGAAGVVAIGSGVAAAATNPTDGVYVGNGSASALINGAANTFVGQGSGATITSGANNVFLGHQAGHLIAADTTNSVAIGRRALVTGNDQFQLGNSNQTTYSYGAVQNRSDSRDKTSVRDTVLGMDFIKDLRPVDYKWDIRDDYVITHEDGTVETLPKDGRMVRERYHHGLIAQELRDVMHRHGVDFGGFQDHSVNGGRDVLSIGYTELIGPLIKAVQQLNARVESLENQTGQAPVF